MSARCSPDGRTAILSFHSHSDRSFLDDRELALVSGDLAAQGFANDVVLTVLGSEAGRGESESERRLATTLRAYDLVVYERVWSRELVQWLRGELAGVAFVSCRGEHALEDPPADYTLSGDLRRSVPALVAWLRGHVSLPPSGTRRRDGERFVAMDGRDVAGTPLCYQPNLRPVVVNPEALPPTRTFSLTGNRGCPFQLDARNNPLYRGIEIPAQYGKGCAFCTTGNEYSARPNEETASDVLEQVRYIRTHAPEMDLLVLKDQNPFGYLTEVMAACVDEGLGDFSLLLETRADWLLRSARRFERALEMAARARIKVSPFLVGIENFSQPELDRFNKGTTASANIEFLETLWRWKKTHGEALDLGHASFGFVLFTPWTALSDLRANFEAVRRTNFHRLRGSILHSRARLYPDTALFYLAEKDGLLSDAFLESEDNSRRYGYYPARPWRFLHPDTAHFAALAVELTERTDSRNQIRLFECLLSAFETAVDYRTVDAEAVLSAYRQPPSAARDTEDIELRRRFEKLVSPLDFVETFAEGWRLKGLRRRPGLLEVEMRHPEEGGMWVQLVPRGDGPRYHRSKHYDIRVRTRDMTPAQRLALDALCLAITQND